MNENKWDIVDPPLKTYSKQQGIINSILYNGSRFTGQQKSKGNSYDVEVILLVRHLVIILFNLYLTLFVINYIKPQCFVL